MTPTLPRHGSRPRARRLLSRLAAVLVVASLAVSGAPAAAADIEPPTPEPAPVLSLSMGVEAQIGGPVAGSITVDNRTESDLDAGTAVVELNETALTDGAALDAWLGAGTASGVFQHIATETTPAVSQHSSQTVNLVAAADAIDDLEPGVYPIRARLGNARAHDDQTWDLTAASVLVVTAAERSTAVLVPITATPASGSLLTADELAGLTAPDGALSGQLDAVTDTPAILAIDPAIPAAIRMLGTAAPSSATDWLQRMQSLPNDKFALQFADADATVQAHAGLSALLSPPDLTPLMQNDGFPTPAPSPTATSTSSPEPELPDNEALTAINAAHSGILWPRPEATADDLATFTHYLGDEVTTILPASAVSGSPTAHSTAQGHDLLIADDVTSARLSAAVELVDRAQLEHELAAAAGHLFFATQRSSTVILALSRSETRSPAALRDALTAFATPQVTLSKLRAAPAAAVSMAADAADAAETADSRAQDLKNMLNGEKQVTEFASILDEPALLLAPDRIRLLRTIGVGVDDEEHLALTAEYSERVRSTLDSVGIQRPKPVQLFTSAAPLPVWVRNDLPWDINVSLIGSPSNPRLDMQPVTQVKALALSVQRVDVPLEALVASGEVDVTFTLRSAANTQIGSPEIVNVTLRADWERIGLGILGGLIVLLLVFGTVRTIRKKKIANAATDAPVRASASPSSEPDTRSENR